jgi:hypothetical protein
MPASARVLEAAGRVDEAIDSYSRAGAAPTPTCGIG